MFLKGGVALLVFCAALSLIWMKEQQNLIGQAVMAEAVAEDMPCVVPDAPHGGSSLRQERELQESIL